ncbi:MAG: DUF938 domain-containing protein [Proteobacteria bacterium]|nr:DUF938 domain-containing protein [Pseudomonadota bacterium]
MDRGKYAQAVSASAERNKAPILDVLRRILPKQGRILEIAAGTGQHAAHFADAMPGLDWQPSDPDGSMLASIDAWRDASGASNLRAPITLDATAESWPFSELDAVYCANMIHIAPWEAGLGLIRNGAASLKIDGTLVLYGPYKIGGKHTAASNEAFDQRLRAENRQWGIRNLDDVALEARRMGFQITETVKMPANNFMVVFKYFGVAD